MDEQIEKQLEDYINQYVSDCMVAQAFVSLPPDQQDVKKKQLNDYFNSLIFETMIDNLNDEQVAEMEKIEDFTTPESLAKVQLLAAQIPGFLLLIDEKFQKETENIKQSGQIPQPQV